MNHSQLLLHWHNRCKHRSSCIWHLVINITICYHVSYEKIYIPLEFPNGFDNLGFTTLCQRYKPQELEDKFSEKVTYFRTNVVWRVGWASKFFFFCNLNESLSIAKHMWLQFSPWLLHLLALLIFLPYIRPWIDKDMPPNRVWFLAFLSWSRNVILHQSVWKRVWTCP